MKKKNDSTKFVDVVPRDKHSLKIVKFVQRRVPTVYEMNEEKIDIMFLNYRK